MSGENHKNKEAYNEASRTCCLNLTSSATENDNEI